MRERDNVPHIIIERGGSGGGVGPFLLGAILGAGAALLLAPRTGKEAQREIRERASRLGEGAERAVQDLRHQFEERVDAIRGAVDTGIEAAQNARSELEERIGRSKAVYRAAAQGSEEDAGEEAEEVEGA